MLLGLAAALLVAFSTLVVPLATWLTHVGRVLMHGEWPHCRWRLVTSGGKTLLQTPGEIAVCSPERCVAEMSRGPISKQWRFKMDVGPESPIKMFPGLGDEEAVYVKQLLEAVGFTVRIKDQESASAFPASTGSNSKPAER